MVEADVLALEVKRLRAALASVAEQVFGLENRKEQLRFSMQERKHEIEVGCCLLQHHLGDLMRLAQPLEEPMVVIGLQSMLHAVP